MAGNVGPRINGFKPVRYLNGAPWTGKARMYVHSASDATALHIGDFVIQEANSQDGFGSVTRSTSGSSTILVGAVVGIDWVHPGGASLQGTNLPLESVYVPASTLAYVWVADDPNIIFEGEFDALGDQPNQTDVGLNYEFLLTAGNTTTGASGMTIDSSTEATTATLPLKLLGLARKAGIDIVDDATDANSLYKRGWVMINTHAYGRVVAASAGVLGV